ncbi:hypothetical protein GGI17_004800 [Coemansia sp. S146]|nr:hypothetical protein GGI17_004800 [Coemansia sp. S146]
MDNNNNNVPEVTAASRIERLEFSLELANEMLVERRKVIVRRDTTIADQQSASNEQLRTIAEQKRAITERDKTIAEQRHTIAEHERADIEQRRTIADLRHAITERDQMIARISEHSRWLEYHSRQVTTMATAAVTAHNTITLSNGAPPGNVGPDEDVPSQDDAAPRAAAPRDDNTALGDDLDNAASGADDDDLVDTASDADDTTAGDDTGAAATDDATSGADDDAPAEEIAVSLHVAKRRRLDQQVRDGSERAITSEDLLGYTHPLSIIDVGVLARVYELYTSRQLIPAGVEARTFSQRLAGLDHFTRWKPRFTEAEASELIGLNLLRRNDRELESLRPNVLRQLGLAGRQRAVVLGPRLCYVLVTMGGIPPEKMTSAIIDKMFRMITQRSLRSLRVVTRNGTRQMEIDELRNLAKVWVDNLCDFIVEEGGVERSLALATRCNNSYKRKCNRRCDPGDDSKGATAMEVLAKDKHKSNLFLGLDEGVYDLKALYRRFFVIVDSSVDEGKAARLRQIADS